MNHTHLGRSTCLQYESIQSSALSAKYEVIPTVLIRRNECGGGEVDIEFSDDYNEEAKPLIDEYAKIMGLEFENSCHVSAEECGCR